METLKLQELGLETIPVVPEVVPNHTTLNTDNIDRSDLVGIRTSLEFGDPIKMLQIYKLNGALEILGAVKILDLILNTKANDIRGDLP